MEINLSKLSVKEIVAVCIKYDIIRREELKNHTRDGVLREIGQWCKYKQKNYKSRPRSYSSPDIKSFTVDKNNSAKNMKPVLQRRNSSPMNIHKPKSKNDPPQHQQTRDRRMSEPFTQKEKEIAKIKVDCFINFATLYKNNHKHEDIFKFIVYNLYLIKVFRKKFIH